MKKCWAILFCCFISVAANAIPVGQCYLEHTITGWANTTNLAMDDFDLQFFFSLFVLPGQPSDRATWSLSADDLGKTFTETALSHTTFAGHAAKLTNGTDNYFVAMLVGPSSSNATTMPMGWESDIPKTVSTYPDFAGLEIDKISITLTKFSITFPYYKDGDMTYTAYNKLDYGLTIVFDAVVPEPVSAAFLAFGGLAVLRQRRKK